MKRCDSLAINNNYMEVKCKKFTNQLTGVEIKELEKLIWVLIVNMNSLSDQAREELSIFIK